MSTMESDPRHYEPRVDTTAFLDSNGEYTPSTQKSLNLPPDRQRIVNTVIEMYNGQITDILDDFQAVYSKSSVYDDIMSFADTRYV